jgi:hypothetical protein
MLDNSVRVQVATFKSKLRVDIRKVISKAGGDILTKKGISLDYEQWKNLMTHEKEIELAFMPTTRVSL